MTLSELIKQVLESKNSSSEARKLALAAQRMDAGLDQTEFYNANHGCTKAITETRADVQKIVSGETADKGEDGKFTDSKRDSDAGAAVADYSEPYKKEMGEGYHAVHKGPKRAHLYHNGKFVDTAHPKDMTRIKEQHKLGQIRGKPGRVSEQQNETGGDEK